MNAQGRGKGAVQVLRALEGPSGSGRQVGAPNCVNCGKSVTSGGVKLNESLVDQLLRALIVYEEDAGVADCRLFVCEACEKSKFLDSFFDELYRFEMLRFEFNKRRKIVGRHVLMGSLGRSKKDFRKWEAEVALISDVLPLGATRNLKTTKDVAVGPDIQMIPQEIKVESVETNNAEEGRINATTEETSDPSDLVIVRVGSLKISSVENTPFMNKAGPSTSSKLPPPDLQQRSGRKRKQTSPVKQETSLKGHLEHDFEDFADALLADDENGMSRDFPYTAQRPRRSLRKRGNFSNEQRTSRKDLKTSIKTEVHLKRSSFFNYSSKGGKRFGVPVKCDNCGRNFSYSLSFQKHVVKCQKEVKDGGYACQFCSKICATLLDLNSHQNKHVVVTKKPKPLICDNCGRGFIWKYQLQEHLKTVHFGDKSACDVCGKQFYSKQTMDEHKVDTHATESESQWIKCSLCPSEFLRDNLLGLRRHSYLIHKRDFLKDMPYVCLVCYHLFPSLQTLELHKKVHETLEGPNCAKKPFVMKGDLKVPLMTHNVRRTFPCSVCSKTFSKEGFLQRHTLTHKEV